MMNDIWVIERVVIDTLENRWSEAVSYVIDGYVTTEQEARKIELLGGYFNREDWPYCFEKIAKYRATKVPYFNKG